MGIASLVLGILAVLLSLFPGAFFVAIALGVVALVLGIVGRKSAMVSGQPGSSATAGIALGSVALVFGVAMWIMCSLVVRGAKNAANEITAPIKKAIDDAQAQAKDQRLNGVKLDPANALRVSAETLAKEAKTNELAAQNRYSGRTCEVRGTVGSVQKEWPIDGVPDAVMLTFDVAGNQALDVLGGVTCHMPVSQTKKALELKRGDQVTVLGRCSVQFGVQLVGCILK